MIPIYLFNFQPGEYNSIEQTDATALNLRYDMKNKKWVAKCKQIAYEKCQQIELFHTAIFCVNEFVINLFSNIS